MWINLFILTTGLHVFHHTHHDHTWFGKECKRYQMSSARLLIGGSHTHTHTHTFSLQVLIISGWLCCRSVSHHPTLDSSSYQSSDLGECFLPLVGEQRRGRWRSRSGGRFLEFTCCLSGCLLLLLLLGSVCSISHTGRKYCKLQLLLWKWKERKKKKITYSLELWQPCFTHRSSPVLVHLQS